MRSIELAGRSVSVIGQGTWHMAEDRQRRAEEIAALRQGVERGMNLIDTAEMYADGAAERLVGEAIAGLREQVFLVSKVYPHHASRQGLPQACERSLERLGVEHIDLYLLHWQGQYPLEETVEAFERLREAGKIGRWGVSNFDLAVLQRLDDTRCATNQVLYNLEQRGIEFDLLPACQQQGLPLMAYSPLAQGGRLLRQAPLARIAERLGVTPAQVCLAWVVRQPGVIAIPKASDARHVAMNAAAGELVLSAEDRQVMDELYPAPRRKQRLAVL
jgi:diketogulonate reductase-like aldo/keto reductase